MIIFVLILCLCLSNASPVIYRISVAEPGESPEPDPKWQAISSGYGRGKLLPEASQRSTMDLGAALGRSAQLPCQHQYALGNVGQPGYSRYPSNYAYQSGYPLYYYLQYAAPVSPTTAPTSMPPLPSPQPQQLQTQQKPPAVDQFHKQAVQYERPTTPTPQKSLSPFGLQSISYPVSGSTWQSYMCSVFPYMPSCQAQAQPSQLLSSYQGYGSYPGYPGYQQMAQYPVYYIVQSDTRPSANVAVPPGTVGIIKISGPTTIKSDVAGKPQPVEADTTEGERKPQDAKDTSASNGDSVRESSELPTQEAKPETTKQPLEKESE